MDPQHGNDELHAFEELGAELDISRKSSKKAYQKARKTADEFWKEKVKKQYAEAKQKGRKVLVVGHSYVLEDALRQVPLIKPDYPLKVGIIGEYFTVQDAFSNSGLE